MPNIRRSLSTPMLVAGSLVISFTLGVVSVWAGDREDHLDADQNATVNQAGEEAMAAENSVEATDSDTKIPESQDNEDLMAPPLTLPMTLEQRFGKAEWVSLVRVEGIGTLINPTMSRTKMFNAVQAYNYRVAALKNWKGEQSGNFKFRVDLTDCLQPLAPDGEYVVFGITNIHGRLQSMSCDDIMPLDRESGVMASLDELSEPVDSSSAN